MLPIRKGISILIVVALLAPSFTLILPTAASPVGAWSPSESDGTGRTEQRANTEVWTDTDWSGVNTNLSIDVEADLTPGELALSSDLNDMLLVFSPSTREGLFAMTELGDRLYMTASAPGTGLDRTAFYSCDIVALQCELVADLEEDMVYDLAVNENSTRIYIPGALSTNSSVDGGIYVYNGTNISLMEVGDITSRSLGVRSVVELDKKIFVTSFDDDSRAHIYRSVNDGQSWTKQPLNLVPKPYDRRFNAIGGSGDLVFVQPDGLADEGARTYVFDGGSWAQRPLPGLTTDMGAFVDVDGDQYFLNAGHLYRYDGGVWVQVPAPFTPTVSDLEIYNTTTGNFSTVGQLSIGRTGHTADALGGNNKSVVMAGGYIAGYPTRTTEVYDASTGVLTMGGDMLTARAYHASVVLGNGLLLVTGGLTGVPPLGYLATTKTERYNLTTDIWTVASDMSNARFNHTATLLPDGRVLVIGGMNTAGGHIGQAEIFDPQTGTWTPTSPMSTPRSNHVAVLLDNGTVLVAGGRDGSGALNHSELYDPGTDTWYITGDTSMRRWGATGFKLSNGNVLLAGGFDENGMGVTLTMEYDTSTSSWAPASDLVSSRFGAAGAVLADDEFLLTGGMTDMPEVLTSAETYSSGTWTSTTSGMAQARFDHRSTVIDPSSVLISGGSRGTALNNSTFKAITTYGQEGLLVGSVDGRLHTMDASGNWTSSGAIPGGAEIMDVIIHHGRAYASTRAPAKVYVASASPSGTMVSVPHMYINYAEAMTIEWDALVPPGTSLKFQVRSGRDLEGLNSTDFTGPDGLNTTYFTTSGSVLGDEHIGSNWFQFKVVLGSTDPLSTPVLQEVRLVMNGTPLVLTTIEVTPESATITADDYIDFNATGLDQFGLEMPILPTWSVQNGNINPTNGNFSPREVGTWTVSARAMSVEGTAIVTVDPGVLAEVRIDPPNWFGSTDETVTFTALGLDQRGNNASFSPVWAASGGGAITTDGVFDPRTPGTWKIYANDSSTGIGGNVTTVVWSGNPSRIEISPESATLVAGEHQLFQATVLDADGNVLDTPVQWSVDGGGSINMLGNFTATNSGQWKVMANITLFEVTAEVDIIVDPGPLYRIDITPAEVSMRAGETMTFKAEPVDEYGNTVSVSIRWAATGGGDFSNGVFTPTKTGTWIIFANASGMSAKVEVSVKPGALHLVVITTDGETDPVVIEGGEGKMFYAQAEDEFGNPIPGLTYIWSVPAELGRIDQTGGFIAGAKAATGEISVSVTQDDITRTGTIDIEVLKVPGPSDGPGDPIYYFLLEFVILIVIAIVAMMVLLELFKVK